MPVQVYWNSRLDTEHRRLVSLLLPGDTLWDAFAGVGPFAVPSGKKGVSVLANDLNPDSVRWLQRNVLLNKVENRVTCTCSDARSFLQRLCSCPPPPTPSQAEAKGLGRGGGGHVHVAMNLPATATDFLDVFRGAFAREMWPEECLPTVHVYAFSASEDPKEDIRQRVSKMLAGEGGGELHMQLHLVRDVAPKKMMVSALFTLMMIRCDPLTRVVTRWPRFVPV